MNLRKIRREMGDQVVVTRDRKTKAVQVAANGLSYRMDERAFGNEREMAEFASSKLPALRVIGNGQ